MKKLFAILMSVLMIACFMPTMAFATATENCTGTCTHQAAIGTTHYDTLAEAITAAAANDIITLLSDVTVDSTIIVNKDLTIAGGEYTLNVENNATVAEVHEDAILTISSGKYTANDSHGVIAVGSGVSAGGKLIVNGGTFQNTETCIASFKGGEVVINDGIFTSTDNFQVCTNGTAGLGGNKITINGGTFNGTIKSSGYIACGIYIANDDELVVNGGTFNITNGIGIVARAGSVTVNGGTFNCTGSAKGKVGDKDFDLDAAKDLYFDNSNPAYPGYNSETNFMKVQGGTFSDLSALDYLGENADVTIKLDEGLTMSKDVSVTGNKKVTLDLNGKTMDTGAKKFELTKGATLTVKDSEENGKLHLNSSSLSVSGSTLNLESGTIEITPKNAGAHTIAAYGNSKVNMSGGSIVAHNTACFNIGYYGTQEIDITGGTLICNDGATPVIGISTFLSPDPETTIRIRGNTVIKMKPEDKEPNVLVSGLTDGNELYVTGGTFDIDPSSYISGDYIAKRMETSGVYSYDVLKKSGLTSGVYMSDPTGALASRYYVSDSNGGEGPWTVSYAGGGSSSSTTTTTDNVTNKTEDKAGSTTASTTATVKAETKTSADGTKTTTATVDTTTATKIVEKAVENKSEEVVVNTATTTAGTVTETAAGTKTEVALPEQTVKSIANETEAAVTIKSDAAEVKLDKEAVKAVAEQAGDTGTVSLVVETVAQNETKVEVDLKLVTSKGNVTEFKGGNVTVTVKLNAALAAKPVVCVYIDDFGTYHKVKGVKNANGTYTFETGHFSTYAVMAEEDADKVITEQTANVERLVSGLSLKARSTKTEKGNIKVTLTVNADDIRQIEDLGYTVKYKFYRSTKKAASYKAKIEGTGKTYTNTAGTKGTRYYYKARVMVYDAQGALVAKTALKQCKYACRVK